MLKDVTLGQYFPGSSFIHRLDPRSKLLFTVIYIAALFIAKSWISYCIILAVFLAMVIVAKIPASALVSGLKPIAFLIVLTAILNLLYQREGRVLASFWIITITDQGLIRAGYMILRIMLLIMGTLMLTYTTTPLAITDGMEKLLSPLKRIRFPVHELSMMMSIALRFIPTLIEETDKIMNAQKARGADFETGRLTQRAKALLPLLIPLFVSAFRRADELATAMESRCYNGGDGRTRMSVLKMSGADLGFLAFSAFMLATIIFLAVRFGI
ncbi:MAG: energy-coupling factor transporter transmembrane protein EcfT [Oscillospiraceae bacterium]|jgi:energy-coupling factor transport system permease protein|nr:energy-coupling factor transporter transmembrane protein EcfT [Oscillospiraceae bacterium]